MAAALSASLATLADRAAAAWAITAALRDRLAAIPGVTVHGHPTQRVPHLVCFSVEGLDPATLAMTLDDRGVSIGSGSPATGRADDPSPVLDAIGYPGTTSFRVGLTPGTSPLDVYRFTHVLADAVGSLRRMHAIASRPVGRAGPDPAAR
jgi:cysteine desulfurase